MSDSLTAPSPLVPVLPDDPHDQKLLRNVRPPDWVNPDPAPRYNLVVLGAGTAGLVTAAAAAGLGARVALVEKSLMGGDCLNVGCVPSKAVIRSAKLVREFREAARFGIRVAGGVEPDFGAVMERMRAVRAAISRHDSAPRFRDLGVDVFLGEGRFAGPDVVEVDGRVLRFRKAVVATGASPMIPPIPGVDQVEILTNETVFNLTRRPGHLLVVGGGPIGCELAQAFARLGSRVTIVEMLSQFLPREDPDAARILLESLQRDGVVVRLGTTVARFEAVSEGTRVFLKGPGGEESLVVDRVLMGAGRMPNVQGLNLEAVGVAYDARKGIQVDAYLRTTNKRIFAAGDVCLPYQFTHTADAAARVVVQNALFPFRKKFDTRAIPWCTYTDPEIAHVGLYEHEAARTGRKVRTFQVSMAEVDRAVTDGEETGFVKIHVEEKSDKILGATVVAARAGDLISEITLAMVHGVGLGKIADVIHPYPTQAEAVRKVADAYNRTRLTPTVKKLFERWLAWSR